MEIGGYDIIMPAKLPAAVALQAAVRRICREWPDAVFENAITAEVYPDFASISFDRVTELFVFRDHAAADVWDHPDQEPCNDHDMVHLLCRDNGEDELTAVVGDREKAAGMMESIRDGLAEAEEGMDAELVDEMRADEAAELAAEVMAEELAAEAAADEAAELAAEVAADEAAELAAEVMAEELAAEVKDEEDAELAAEVMAEELAAEVAADEAADA
jgi:hypothetical protein